MKAKVLLSLILIAECSALGSRAMLAQLEDVMVVPKGTKLMMDLETPLDSFTNREGDDIYLRIRNDIRVGNKLAIPRGVVIKGNGLADTTEHGQWKETGGRAARSAGRNYIDRWRNP